MIIHSIELEEYEGDRQSESTSDPIDPMSSSSSENEY